MEYGIKEQGIKAAATVFTSKDFSDVNANENAKSMVITEKQGDYEVTIELSKVKVNEADLARQRGSSGNAPTTNGTISTSRSNIKIVISKLKSNTNTRE